MSGRVTGVDPEFLVGGGGVLNRKGICGVIFQRTCTKCAAG